MTQIEVVQLDPEIDPPVYALPGDAGADLCSVESVAIRPGGWALIGTGISLAIPDGYVGLVHPRSGLAVKYGVTVLGAPGTVDSGYRGEVKVNLVNYGPLPFQVVRGDRIAQLLIQRVEHAQFVRVDELPPSERGDRGYGSTGVR